MPDIDIAFAALVTFAVVTSAVGLYMGWTRDRRGYLRRIPLSTVVFITVWLLVGLWIWLD